MTLCCFFFFYRQNPEVISCLADENKNPFFLSHRIFLDFQLEHILPSNSFFFNFNFLFLSSLLLLLLLVTDLFCTKRNDTSINGPQPIEENQLMFDQQQLVDSFFCCAFMKVHQYLQQQQNKNLNISAGTHRKVLSSFNCLPRKSNLIRSDFFRTKLWCESNKFDFKYSPDDVFYKNKHTEKEEVI